jgi:hypothetical protein
LHHDVPFNRRACCFDITGEWSLRAVSRRGRPLIGRMLCYWATEDMEKWSRAPVLPREFAAKAAKRDALRGIENSASRTAFLAPNEAGLLTPSRANSKMVAEAGFEPAIRGV